MLAHLFLLLQKNAAAPSLLMVHDGVAAKSRCWCVLLLVSQILASDLTSGYSVRNCLLSSVDGTKVINLRHLAQLLGIRTPQQQQPHKQEQPQEQQQKQQEQRQQSEFVTFVLEEKLQVVLNREKAEAMLPEILKQHAIHSQTSDNL